jgi:hypothetical protein
MWIKIRLLQAGLKFRVFPPSLFLKKGSYNGKVKEFVKPVILNLLFRVKSTKNNKKHFIIPGGNRVKYYL